jgi:hypothetical protein
MGFQSNKNCVIPIIQKLNAYMMKHINQRIVRRFPWMPRRGNLCFCQGSTSSFDFTEKRNYCQGSVFIIQRDSLLVQITCQIIPEKQIRNNVGIIKGNLLTEIQRMNNWRLAHRSRSFLPSPEFLEKSQSCRVNSSRQLWNSLFLKRHS